MIHWLRQHWPRLVPLAVLILLGFHLSPIWRDLSSWGGTFDWGYFFFLAEVDTKTIGEFGQLPLWNPYYCGGAVHLANPQAYTLSPFSLFLHLFGTPLGMRLMITSALLLGVDGTRRWCQELGLGPTGSWTAGAFVATSGILAQHVGGGHIGWMGYALIPYTFWAFERALAGDRRFVAVMALWLAWIFVHFGVYPYPHTALALGAYGLARGFAVRKPLRAAALGVAGAVLSLMVVGLRLVPMYEFIREHPREVAVNEGLSIVDFYEIYLARHTDRWFAGHKWQWPEYGNYMGWFLAASILVGMVVAWRSKYRRAWVLPMMASLLFGAWLQLGNHPYYPWWLLIKMPVVENLRVPSRFTVLVTLFSAPFLAAAVERALQSVGPGGSTRGRVLSGALLLCVTVGLVEATQFNRLQWFQTFRTPPPQDIPSPDFHNVSGHPGRMYAYPRANRGSLACFEESPLPKSPLLGATRVTEEYLADPAAGEVQRVHWSPNAIELRARLTRPTTVLVNQNYHEGWSSSQGEVIDHQGLLAVALPAGEHTFTLRFWPRSVTVGLATTLVGLILCAVVGFGPWFRPREEDA